MCLCVCVFKFPIDPPHHYHYDWHNQLTKFFIHFHLTNYCFHEMTPFFLINIDIGGGLIFNKLFLYIHFMWCERIRE
jgi:hypothetical protein